MSRRRKIGRPLLVVAAGTAALAYACGTSEISGNLIAINPEAGPDMGVSETSGNLLPADVQAPDTSVPDAGDGGDATTDAPKDAPGDGG